MNQDLKQYAQLHDENIEAIKIAVKLSEHLEAKEQAMFIAGFEECLKWQAEQDKKEIERMKTEMEWIKIDNVMDIPAGELLLLATNEWITTGFRYHLYFEADDSNRTKVNPTHYMILPDKPKQ